MRTFLNVTEHYGASFGDYIDANEVFQTYQMVIQFILIINRRFDAQLSSFTLVRQNTYLYYSFIGLKCTLFLMSNYLISIVLIKCLHIIILCIRTIDY